TDIGRYVTAAHRSDQGFAYREHGTHRRSAGRRRCVRRCVMLMYLAEFLEHFYSGFRVFQFLTFRAILGVLTAMVFSFMFGPWMIRRLAFHQIGQNIRDDGPQSHLVKAGTPTMGGTLILAAVLVSTLLWADVADGWVWLVLL